MMENKQELQRAYLNWLLTPPSDRNPDTKTAFAQMIGVVRKTLYNWEQEEWFQQQVRDAKGVLNARWYGDIVGRLKEIVDKGKDSDSIAAARILMAHLETPDTGQRKVAVDVDELQEALEALIKASGK